MRRRHPTGHRFHTGVLEKTSAAVTRWAGSSAAVAAAVAVVVIWAVLGPVFHFSDTWQLVINTGTTVVTFLMVFLIQRSQNKDARAIHLKLNELIAVTQGASNRLIDVEALSEEELEILSNYFAELVKLSRKDNDMQHSHSVEEARNRHSAKNPPHRPGRPAKV
jgi:low affinity Fe/Cu permease